MPRGLMFLLVSMALAEPPAVSFTRKADVTAKTLREAGETHTEVGSCGATIGGAKKSVSIQCRFVEHELQCKAVQPDPENPLPLGLSIEGCRLVDKSAEKRSEQHTICSCSHL